MARRGSETMERIRAACTFKPPDFVDQYLFGAPPYAFRSSPAEYDQFRTELGIRLGVPAQDLILVGSGRLGFSLNPDHLAQPFLPSSDLDMVIVSSEIFDGTWTELVEKESDISLASEDERHRIKRTKDHFFKGYLRPDHLPLSIGLATEWFPKLASRFASAVANRHEVEGWLFKSAVHARVLYTRHLQGIQADIRQVVGFREEE
jgi:hypothetical protein